MRRKLVAGFLVVLVGGVTLSLGARAEASGVTTHSWMATDAVPLVDDPQLMALLEANIDQVAGGAHFPDSGYGNSALGYEHTFGEESHWPRFSYAYADQIRADETCGDLTDPDGPCAARIAHLMGSIAHGMGDEVWDWLFEPNAPDRGESYVPPALIQYGFGTGGIELQMDLIAIGDHDRPSPPPALPPWPDKADLLDVFHGIGREDIVAQDLLDGEDSMRLVREGERAFTRFYHDHITTNMPWTAAHMITAPGGVDFAAVAIAAAYESLWGRLLGDQPATEVSITYPADGQTEVPRIGWDRASFQPGSAGDRGGAQTRITAVLSGSLPYRPDVDSPAIPTDLPAGSMTLTEVATGEPVPIRAGYPRAVPYNPEAGEHTIDIQPDANLAKCTEYRVDVTDALIDGTGEPVVPYSWTFTTKGCPGVRARPDAQLRVGDDGVWMGWDVFSRNGADQNRAVTTPSGTAAEFTLRFRNDGNRTERLTLKSQRSLPGFGLAYFDASGANISGAMKAGTYRTAPIAPGGEVVVELRVDVRDSAPEGASITRRIKARSSVSSTVVDAVTATVTEGAAPEIEVDPDFDMDAESAAALVAAVVCDLE